MASRLPVLLRLPRNVVLRWRPNQNKFINRSYRSAASLTHYTFLIDGSVYGVHNFRRQLFHRSANLWKAQNDALNVIIDVTYEEVVAGVNEDTIQMLDVRMPEELQETGTIGPAFNIPVQDMTTAVSLPDDDFEEKYGFQKSELSNNNLVVYCLAGLRAKAAVNILHQAGFINAKRYPGSWEEWVERQEKKK